MRKYPIGSASSSSHEGDQKRPRKDLRTVLRGTSSVSRIVLSYGLAPVLVATALLLSLLLQPLVPIAFVFLFLAAVVASASLGRRGPGLFAVPLASAAVDYFFIPPIHTVVISREGWAYFIPFLLSALVAAWTSSMRKRAEDKLRLQSAALESAANAIVITDPRGSIQWVNPAFTELTGYSFEESVGHNPRILKSGKHEESFYQNLWKTILAGEICAGQIENRKKDGQLYTEEMTIAPVRSKTGGIANFIAINLLVTEYGSGVHAGRTAGSVGDRRRRPRTTSSSPCEFGWQLQQIPCER